MKKEVVIGAGTLLALSLGAMVFSQAGRTPQEVPQKEGKAVADKAMALLNDKPLAIVFERTSEKRVCLGPASAELAADAASWVESLPATAAPTEADREVWVLGKQGAQGLWYSTKSKQAGRLSPSLSVQLKPTETAELPAKVSALVASAKALPKATKTPIEGKFDLVGSADYRAPKNLESMSRKAEVIAVGTVMGVLRQNYSPANVPGMAQHTVYALAVDTYLKSDENGMPPVIKVWNTGGSLPWKNADFKTSGIGNAVMDDPLLGVGQRYLLFLKRPSDSSGFFKKQGYISAEANGITGPVANLDEYHVVTPMHGKVLLMDHRSYSASVVAPKNRPSDENWQFQDGSTLVGMTEIMLLQEASKAARASSAEHSVQ